MKLKIFILFIVFGILSCTSIDSYKLKPTAKPAPTTGIKTLQNIKKNEGRKPLKQTLKKLNQLIKENKNNTLALNAYLFMARLLYKNNKKAQACAAYHQAVALPFSYKNQNRAIYASAKCLKKEGKLEKALRLLESRLRIQQETLSYKKEMAQLQWQFIKNKKSFKTWKIKVLSHLIHFSSSSQEVEKYKEQANRILKELTSSELLSLGSKAETYRSFEGLILFYIGELKWEKGYLSQAKSYFKKALITPLDSSIEKKIQFYLKITKTQSIVNSKRIGVILPLTGKRKALGKKILRGLQLGLGLMENSSYQLIIMDSKDHVDVTKDAVEKLLYDHHVVALVGGLSGNTAEVIAEIATNFGIPSILFSHKAELTKNRYFIFQNAITSEILTAQLVQTVFKKSSMKNFAILYPEDSYGREYKKLFTKEVSDQGGTVVFAESYKSEETDFKDSIKKLIHLYDLKERNEEYQELKQKYLKKHSLIRLKKKKLRPENILKPIIDFDGIFIPDSIQTLKKVIAHLEYFGIKDMNLLGTNLWKSSSIKSWSKDFSLFFINTPSLSKEKIRNSSFYINYKNQFRSSPGLFERKAYNAGLALRTILDKKNQNRIQLQKQLENLKNLNGAFFPFGISKNRIFTYPLTIYSSQKGKTFSLDSVLVN